MIEITPFRSRLAGWYSASEAMRGKRLAMGPGKWPSWCEMCEVLIREGAMPKFLEAFPGYHIQVRKELPKSLHPKLPKRPANVEEIK